MARNKSDTVSSHLRLPTDLHNRLATHASVSSRSLNAEVIRRLEASFSLETLGTRAAWEADQREKYNNAADIWQKTLAEQSKQLDDVVAANVKLHATVVELGKRIKAVEARETKRPARRARAMTPKVIGCRTAVPNVRAEA